MFTHERDRLFHGEGANLTCSMLFALIDGPKIYLHLFHDLFDLSNKQGGRVLLGEIRSSGEEKITHVCVGGECALTIFYSSQAPMKRAWNPLLPQIFITEQCESLCERQIIFENPPVLTLGQKILVLYIGYMLISPSRDVVISLFRDSYYKSVR